jgi:hypothetical protein
MFYSAFWPPGGHIVVYLCWGKAYFFRTWDSHLFCKNTARPSPPHLPRGSTGTFTHVTLVLGSVHQHIWCQSAEPHLLAGTKGQAELLGMEVVWGRADWKGLPGEWRGTLQRKEPLVCTRTLPHLDAAVHRSWGTGLLICQEPVLLGTSHPTLLSLPLTFLCLSKYFPLLI